MSTTTCLKNGNKAFIEDLDLYTTNVFTSFPIIESTLVRYVLSTRYFVARLPTPSYRSLDDVVREPWHRWRWELSRDFDSNPYSVRTVLKHNKCLKKGREKFSRHAREQRFGTSALSAETFLFVTTVGVSRATNGSVLNKTDHTHPVSVPTGSWMEKMLAIGNSECRL